MRKKLGNRFPGRSFGTDSSDNNLRMARKYAEEFASGIPAPAAYENFYHTLPQKMHLFEIGKTGLEPIMLKLPPTELLSLGELESLAGTLLAVFLSLFFPGISREESFFFQSDPKVAVHVDNGPRYPMP